MKGLGGTTAVVSGGGSGIGRAVARALAERGARLALVDKREDRLQEVGRKLRAMKVEHATYPCDVASPREVEGTVEKILTREASVQVLVNCAGVSHAGPFLESTIADWEWVFGVNLWGTLYLTRALLPHMLRQTEGHIVNVCSSFGWLGFPEKSAYSASKFALRGLSESLQMELKGTSVGLTVLYPGPVDTGLVRDGRAVDPLQQQAEAEFLKERSISPHRVAEAALKGILKKKDRVVVGLDYRVIDLLVRLWPRQARHLISRIGARKINRRRRG